MLLNGGPLNSAPLNGYGNSVIPQPVPVTRGVAFRWRLRVMIGGEDLSPQLTGAVTVDRERGDSGVARLVLQLPVGPVVPSEWRGREVSIIYVSTQAGETSEAVRFTGRIVRPEWDPLLRLLSCQCGDQLQQRVEGMEVDQIDTLVGGVWSADVYEPVEGRSRWDYAQERLSTVRGSLDAAPDGALRMTSWYAGAPDFVFGTGTTVYESVRFSDADLTTLTNVVEIEGDIRFPRLWQKNVRYTWAHPVDDFCTWRLDSTELPDIAMVQGAVESSGQTLLQGAIWDRLPPTSPDPCGTGQAWINSYPDLLLGGAWNAGRRWTQSVTEQYRLRVVAEASVEAAGEVIGRDRVALEVENAAAEAWESEPFDSGETGFQDLRDDSRRDPALRVALERATTAVVAAHNATEVSWDVPTSMVMGVDLVHTLRLEDQGVLVQSRCSRVYDTFDLAGGIALTTLSVAVMRGGGTVRDPLVPPAPPVYPQPDPDEPSGVVTNLPTQLGGRLESPEYDDELPGFAGNYASVIPGLEAFPRRMDLDAPEIAAERRDELPVEIVATYRVAIPNDLLEL
ncbi:hypothetical protein D9M69_375700 [compost metagenome]